MGGRLLIRVTVAVVSPRKLVPLNITDFRHEQTICMYYDRENRNGNTARFVTFLQENIQSESF